MQIKICGLSTRETIDVSIEAGASHIGLVHHASSPRHLSLERASELRGYCRDRARAVLLLANADIETTGKAIAAVKPDILQFHGSETPEWIALVREELKLECWKGVGVRDAGTLERIAKYDGKVDRLVFDSPAKALPGGNGESFAWSLLAGHEHRLRWALAGGLRPDNVGEAIHATKAEMVDVSSGVESAPGVKDVDLIRAFCEAARSASEGSDE